MGVKNANYKEFRVRQHGLRLREWMRQAM